MKKLLLTVLIALVMQQYNFAQGFDPIWAARFQIALDSVVAADNITGAAAAVFVPEEGIWSGFSGFSQPGVPLTGEMRFGIGSNTKLFIAITLAKLQEQGVLTLNDHLYQWLTTFPNIDSTITIRQLLSHQSGIYNYTENNDFLTAVYANTSHFWTQQEVLEYVLQPYFEPGTGWHYSNTNYILAAMIIESATGVTWDQNLHDHIFNPLEMDSTFIGAFESPNGPIAATQLYGNSGPWCTSPIVSMFSSAGAAGAIFSTSREMVQWYHALFNGEIISLASLQQILDFESTSLYGMAMWKYCDTSMCNQWSRHSGTIMGYRSHMVYDKKTGSALCILTNGGANYQDNWAYLKNLTDPLIKVLYGEYPKQQNDAGIIKIISPQKHICNVPVIPRVILKNFGLGLIFAVSIQYQLDESAPSLYSWTGILNPGDTVGVDLLPFTPVDGRHTLIYYTSNPNGLIDGYTYNDTICTSFIVNASPVAQLQIEESFEDSVFPPVGWIASPDIILQWGRTQLTAFSGNACAVKGNNSDDHIGSKHNLDMPMINLNNVNNPMLSFSYAYTFTQRANWYYDTLKVIISEDCGATWETLFYEGGTDLQTAPWTYDLYFPTSEEWSEVAIPLDEYTGNVIIRFQDICGYGNNLFLDNVIFEFTIGDENEKIVTNNTLVRNYPNPVYHSTIFEYYLDESTWVTLVLYDHLGRQVALVINEKQNKGVQKADWNPVGLITGVYYYRIQAGRKTETGKLILLN